MNDLETLKRIKEEKYLVYKEYLNEIEEAYRKIILSALAKNNFNMDLIDNIYVDVRDSEPNDTYRIDRVDVRIKDAKDDYSLDISIRSDKVQFNNCCSGYWTVNDLYYEYIKLMSILASEVSQTLLDYSNNLDRTILKDYRDARWAVEDEERRLHEEEHRRLKEAKMEEIDNAEYLGQYRTIKWYEEEYVEGETKQVLVSVFKVIKRTPKRLYVKEYFTKQYEGDPDDLYRPSRWYSNEEILKKENIYNPNWKAIAKDSIDILD